MHAQCSATDRRLNYHHRYDLNNPAENDSSWIQAIVSITESTCGGAK